VSMTQDRLEALKAFFAEDPKDPFTRFALAQEYQKRGDHAAALEFFEGLIQDDPEYVGTYYHLGKLYEQLGRRDDAVATYRKGIEVALHRRDTHARAELQDALLRVEGIGFDD